MTTGPPSHTRGDAGGRPSRGGARADAARVCFLTQAGSWGGSEVHTLGVARELIARGHRAIIVELGRDVYARELAGGAGEGLAVARIHATDGLGAAAIYRLLRRVDADAAAIVKGWFWTGSTALALAARLRFGRVVAIEHSTAPPLAERTSRRHLGGLVPGLGLWWYKRRLRVACRQLFLDRTICVSRRNREVLASYGFRARRLVTVANGVDSGRFRPSPAARVECRRRWSVPPGATAFGCVGRLSEEKGVGIAVEAFASYLRAGEARDARLVLAGDGPAREGLVRACEAAGVADRVVFLGSVAEPWQVYPGLDAFLLPSRVEGMPLALLEAMACGCLPVAMDVGGVPEVLADRSLGWLVANGDVRAFAGAMCEAASLPEPARSAMSARCRRHVEAHFDSARCFARVADQIVGVRPTDPRPAPDPSGR